MPREPDFEESADMRLVELQRAALGVTAPQRSQWESRLHAEGSAVDPEGPQHLESAVVAIEASANPPGDVIPGAIVTISVSVANEGAVPARNVTVAVPLPGGVTYRNGSFVRDGRPMLDDAADELFGSGTLIPSIQPRARVTFLWKLGVRLGNKPLVIAPIASAENTAVIGGEAVIVSRKAGAQTGFASEVQRYDRTLYDAQETIVEELPIYELDSEEAIEYEAADAALSEYVPPMEPPLQPIAPPAQPEPAPPPDQPAPDPEPGVPTEEPSTPPPPEQPPDVEPAAREAVMLYGRLDRPSIAYFERQFNGSKPPTLLSHFILGGALACTRGVEGGDIAGLKAHMDAQGQLLQRIVLHEKMGRKEPIGEYAGTMLARVDQFVAAPVPKLSPLDDSNVLLLETELEPPTLTVLRKMQEDGTRWDFTKARQLTLALQARRVVANAAPERVEAAEAALRAYAQTAGTQLQKFFVRMRIDRTTGLLYAHEEALDTAARALIQALIALFPA
jgi:uncharacterized repeat protein (TIGR01451 family)